MLNEMFYRNINNFTYNGQSSLDFGILVERVEGIYGEPQPVINVVNIPGRGNVIINNKADELDNEVYEDSIRKYIVHVIPDTLAKQSIEILARNIHSWLYSSISYNILSDTYEPEYYRLAYVNEPMSISRIAAGLMGKLTIPFTCKTLKYSSSGQQPIIFDAPGQLYNIYGFTAYPLTRIYGSGDVELCINERMHRLTIDDEYIDIDSEKMRSYKDSANKNNLTQMTHYPKLTAGKNTISWSGDVSRLEITPRWCTL